MKLDKIIAVRTGKTVYKDGGRVIKVFENGYSKADILNEALNQARIEETGLNIPKILGVTTEDGKWAIISEYISGKTLSQLMEESPDKADEYLERFVDIQAEIHSKKSPLLTKLKDKMNRKIDMADIDAATRYDLHTRLEGMPRHDKVCHGDFNPSNVIITDSGKPYIIDWAHATRGNASADAARTYLLFRLEKKDDAVALLYENKQRFAADNLEIIKGEAPEALKELPVPTHAFIGGSSGNLKEIVALLLEKNRDVRIVINCISLETIRELTLLETDSRITDLEIIQVQVSRAKTIGGYHLMQGENPIYICSFDFTGEVS